MNRQQMEILDLFTYASDGPPHKLQELLARGVPYDRPVPLQCQSPTIPLNIAAQYGTVGSLAILAKQALDDDRQELIDSKSHRGQTPAAITVQKGHAECFGILAKAGADLRIACPVYLALDVGHQNLVDPDPEVLGGRLPHELLKTVRSFTELKCAGCGKLEDATCKLNVCTRCDLARYCSKDCQVNDFPQHKKCCKLIRKGADQLPSVSRMPMGPKKGVVGFDIPFGAADHDHHREDGDVVWEYNAGVAGKPKWKRFPAAIENDLEQMSQMGGPRYMYKPGEPEALGMHERELSGRPPRGLATHHAYWSVMTEYDIYTGSARSLRRNGKQKLEQEPC